MKNYILFLNQQKTFILTLIFCIAIPFLLLCLYTQNIPYTPYFFLLLLFFIRIIVQSASNLNVKLRPASEKELKVELKRQPSYTEIELRTQFHMKSRDTSLLIAFIYILIMGLLFSKF